MGAPGLPSRQPQLSDEERAELIQQRALRGRARRRAQDDQADRDLEAALNAPWLHGPKQGYNSYGKLVRSEGVRYRIARGPVVATMTRKRPEPHEAGCAPTVRDPDPAEMADEEERRKGPVGRPKVEIYPVGRVVEFKDASLGTWRLGQVAGDDGGRTVEIRGRGPVARRRVRLPKKGVLSAVAQAAATGPPGELPPLAPARVVRTSAARRAMSPQRKPKGRIRDGDYLRFVRQHPCCSCGARVGVQAHHHGGSRGVSQKADDLRTVPLCATCHMTWHNIGRLRSRDCLTVPEAREHLYKTQVDLLIEWMGEAGDLLVEALESAGDPL